MRATARVLIRDGYDALTTNAVAREAGASVGSLYQYFASKESLVAALLDEHIESSMRLMRQEAVRLLGLPVTEATSRFIELMFESHKVDPELHRVFAEQLPRVGDFARNEAHLDEACTLVATYLEAHAGEIVPQDHALSAFVLVSTVETLTHRAVLARPRRHTDARIKAEITRLVHAYLLPPTAASRNKPAHARRA